MMNHLKLLLETTLNLPSSCNTQRSCSKTLHTRIAQHQSCKGKLNPKRIFFFQKCA